MPGIFQKLATCVVSLNKDIAANLPTAFRHCEISQFSDLDVDRDRLPL